MRSFLASAIAIVLLIGVPGLIGYFALGGIMRYLSLRSWKYAACFYVGQLVLVATSAALLVISVGQMFSDGSLDGPTGFGAGALAGVATVSAISLETGAAVSIFLILLGIKRGRLSESLERPA